MRPLIIIVIRAEIPSIGWEGKNTPRCDSIGRKKKISDNPETEVRGKICVNRLWSKYLFCAPWFAFAGLPLNAQQLACLATSSPTQARTAGVTEDFGDVVLGCTGGTPTAAGQPIPLLNIRLTSSAPLTNRVFANGTADVLLLIDEPFPASPFPTGIAGLAGNSGPQQFCVANGTADCELTGTGGSTNPYLNTLNVFQGYAGTSGVSRI
jgi:hypothetical protein